MRAPCRSTRSKAADPLRLPGTGHRRPSGRAGLSTDRAGRHGRPGPTEHRGPAPASAWRKAQPPKALPRHHRASGRTGAATRPTDDVLSCGVASEWLVPAGFSPGAGTRASASCGGCLVGKCASWRILLLGNPRGLRRPPAGCRSTTGSMNRPPFGVAWRLSTIRLYRAICKGGSVWGGGQPCPGELTHHDTRRHSCGQH